jgi:hypothetical protein
MFEKFKKQTRIYAGSPKIQFLKIWFSEVINKKKGVAGSKTLKQNN